MHVHPVPQWQDMYTMAVHLLAGSSRPGRNSIVTSAQSKHTNFCSDGAAWPPSNATIYIHVSKYALRACMLRAVVTSKQTPPQTGKLLPHIQL